MKKPLFCLAAVLAALSAGCSAGTAQTPESVKPAAQTRTAAAPGFRLKQLGAGTVAVSPAQDGALYVLNFWATWCPPCRAELPEIAAFASAHAKDVRFYGIDLDEPEGDVKGFLEKQQLQFPVLLDVGGKVAQQYGVRGIPTTVILNRNGQEVFRKVGGTTSQELEKVLKGLEQ